MQNSQVSKGRERSLFVLILLVIALIAGLVLERTTPPAYAENISGDLIILASLQEQPPAPTPAERIMKALSSAYPDRIGPAEFRNGDWAFSIRGTWFYYAEGRILPERLRNRTEEYRAMGFNSNYPVDLPSWESTAEQRAARTRSYEESRNRPPTPRTTEPRPVVRRPNYFFEALWNLSSRDEAWAQQEQIDFLGFTLTIHSGISQQMRQINQIILNESRTNASVRQWINAIGTIGGWNWRNVASSGNRSFHSYGIAIDILPRDLNGQSTYWLWSSGYNPQWWNIPYSGRYHPPDVVVKTFESFGFTWGGKWSNYDTMHFEYRPEVFILSNIPLAHPRRSTVN